MTDKRGCVAIINVEEKEQGLLVELADSLDIDIVVYASTIEFLRYSKTNAKYIIIVVDRLDSETWLNLEYISKQLINLDTTITLVIHPNDVETLLDKPVPNSNEFILQPVNWDVKLRQIKYAMGAKRDDKPSNNSIYHLAYYDSLTNLPNRNFFNKEKAKMLLQCQAKSSKMAVLFLDINDFKHINDSLGHYVGDKLIIEASKILHSVCRETDTIFQSSEIQSLVSRFGGDEFIILIQNIKSKKDVWIIADRIVSAINHEINIDGYKISLHCSIGISIYPDDGELIEDLVEQADSAMFQAKSGNSSTKFVFYEKGMHASDERLIVIENDMKYAIEKNQFELHFQPQVCYRKQSIVGAESLIRWQHPELGYIPPFEFIPIAERTGQITTITSWVVRTLFAMIQNNPHCDIDNHVYSLNVSSKDFLEEGFLTYLVGMSNYYRIPPEKICIEITETMIMHDIEKSMQNMQYLSDNGFQIAIDDFGTGYSSFSYLHNFPIDTLKIDKIFVDSLSSNDKSQIIISSIISMCDQLGINVIAEGVETRHQFETLRLMNCLSYQGYYFCKPTRLENLAELAHLNIEFRGKQSF